MAEAKQADQKIDEALDLLNEERVFPSLDALIAAEDAENEARWVKWPAVEGAEVLIAHARTSGDKLQELERRYRMRHPKLKNKPIPSIYFLAQFGTTVKDWRGFTVNGAAFPFTETNFLHLMDNYQRFRQFIAETATELQETRDEVREDMGKG